MLVGRAPKGPGMGVGVEGCARTFWARTGWAAGTLLPRRELTDRWFGSSGQSLATALETVDQQVARVPGTCGHPGLRPGEAGRCLLWPGTGVWAGIPGSAHRLLGEQRGALPWACCGSALARPARRSLLGPTPGPGPGSLLLGQVGAILGISWGSGLLSDAPV